MITLIAYVLAVIANLMGANNAQRVVIVPPMPSYAPDAQFNTRMTGVIVDDDEPVSWARPCDNEIRAYKAVLENDAKEWELYSQEAYYDYVAEFTALFNSYETKRTSNGRVMIRSGNSGSFKFAKKG